jgi:hypothetical protein
MKLRWWVVGTVAVLVGGAFVLKHFVDNREKLLHIVDNDNGKKFGVAPSEVPEKEFDEADFLS